MELFIQWFHKNIRLICALAYLYMLSRIVKLFEQIIFFKTFKVGLGCKNRDDLNYTRIFNLIPTLFCRFSIKLLPIFLLLQQRLPILNRTDIPP